VIGPLSPPKVIDNTTMTVFTYDLGDSVAPGQHRALRPVRSLRFSLNDFSNQFIAGASLPSGAMLDDRVRDILAVE
jgi:hypothetical protein